MRRSFCRILGLREIVFIESSARIRLKECKHIDEDGFCTYWYSHKRVEGCEMKEVSEKGEKRYCLNVRKHPLICVACPGYS